MRDREFEKAMLDALQKRINQSNTQYKAIALSADFFPLLDSIQFIAFIQGPDHKMSINMHVPTILVDSHDEWVIADLLWINTRQPTAGQWNEHVIGTRMTRPFTVQ